LDFHGGGALRTIRPRRLTHGAAAAAVALLAVGCGGRWLRWQARPPAPAMVGKVEITVADHRAPKRGGANPRHVGDERNGWGIPFPITLRSPTEAAESIRDLIGQAARSSGVGIAAPGEPVSGRIVVEIEELWCDGAPPDYTARVAAAITVVGADDSPPAAAAAPQRVTVEGGHVDCQRAYEDVLTKAYDRMTALMSQPGFKEAVGAVVRR
jgi:hypothetical protein